MVTSIIPEDIIVTEILPRLPAKSLLRFRSVCKTWNKLISDPLFINQHFNKSVERKAMLITLVFDTLPPTIYSIDPENLDITVPDDIIVPDDMIGYPPSFTSFNYGIGACDGLLCTSYDVDTVSVWHASTRTSMAFAFPYDLLPIDSSYGFFYDSTSCNYKLVSVEYVDTYLLSAIMVHSAGNDDFTLIGSTHYKMHKKAGVVVNGSVHWIAYDPSQDHSLPEQVIFVVNPIYQDLSESFDVIPIPTNKKDGLDNVNLAQLGGSLSIVFSYNQRIEVWLMKEYGVKESWSMYFEIPTDDLYFLNHPLRAVPLYITKKGNLILQINYRKLFIYDQKQKSLKSIKIKYPETGLQLIRDADNQLFYAITLLDSLIDIRNGHGGGRPFLGRQIKRELTLNNCSGNHITEYKKLQAARFIEVVFNTSYLKLYKLFIDCKMDLGAASKKFFDEVQRLVLSEFESYLKREFGLRQPQISGDTAGIKLMSENMESDSASIRQMQFENGSFSSASERLNYFVDSIPESSRFRSIMQRCLNYRFYQLIQNTELDWSVYGDVAARLAILRAASKGFPHLEPEIEATLEQFARDLNASPDSNKGLGDSESGVATKLPVMDTNDASVSSTSERVNNEVCGAPHNQNQQLSGLGEGRCTEAKSTPLHVADGNSSPESPPSKDETMLRS